MKLFTRKPRGKPQFSAIMVCRFCKQEVPFKVDQHDHATQQAVYCDRCGKMNIVAIPALPEKEV